MICVTYETSFPSAWSNVKSPSNLTKVLRLPRKMNVVDDLRHIWNVISNARSQSSHPVLCQYYAGYYFETSCTMRGATRGTVQLHQILRLPHKIKVIDDPHHIWNVISNARSKYSQHPTSPNAAPATQNQCHQRSAAHMKRHFQCTEQLKSPSNLTKHCAWHEILKLKISSETPWSASANRKTIRRYAPATQNECRRWSASGYEIVISNARSRSFKSPSGPHQILAPATLFYCKLQDFAFRLSPKHVTEVLPPITKDDSEHNLRRIMREP